MLDEPPFGDPVLKGSGWPSSLLSALEVSGSGWWGKSPGKSLEILLPADPCLFWQVGHHIYFSIFRFHAATLLSTSLLFSALLFLSLGLAFYFYFFPLKTEQFISQTFHWWYLLNG